MLRAGPSWKRGSWCVGVEEGPPFPTLVSSPGYGQFLGSGELDPPEGNILDSWVLGKNDPMSFRTEAAGVKGRETGSWSLAGWGCLSRFPSAHAFYNTSTRCSLAPQPYTSNGSLALLEQCCSSSVPRNSASESKYLEVRGVTPLPVFPLVFGHLPHTSACRSNPGELIHLSCRTYLKTASTSISFSAQR